MPNGISLGYTARLLGWVTSFEGLYLFIPLEGSVPEGSLMLMRLDFAEFPSSESLSELDQALLDAGVPPWPGNSHIVFTDVTAPSIYLAWVKGIAWMGIILGILGLMVLPVLLGGLIWWLLPQEIKELIMMMVTMGIMFLMFKFMAPVLTEKKPREAVEE